MFETMAGFVLGEHLGGATFEPAAGAMGYSRIVTPIRRPYATRDGFMCILAYNNKQWNAFFRVICRPDMFDDPRFVTQAARVEHIDAVYAFMAAECAKHSNAEWLALLADADIPHAVVMRIEDLADDPHLQAVGFFREFDHPSEGRLRETGFAARWSATPPSVRRHAPGLGEHSEEVLRAAGYSAQDIAAMAERGITRLGPAAG